MLLLKVVVTIFVAVEPLSVVIESRNAPLPAGASLSAHHPALLSCRVLGSRPAAYITWWKGGLQMQGARSWVTFPTTNYLHQTHDKFISVRAISVFLK